MGRGSSQDTALKEPSPRIEQKEEERSAEAPRPGTLEKGEELGMPKCISRGRLVYPHAAIAFLDGESDLERGKQFGVVKVMATVGPIIGGEGEEIGSSEEAIALFVHDPKATLCDYIAHLRDRSSLSVVVLEDKCLDQLPVINNSLGATTLTLFPAGVKAVPAVPGLPGTYSTEALVAEGEPQHCAKTHRTVLNWYAQPDTESLMKLEGQEYTSAVTEIQAALQREAALLTWLQQSKITLKVRQKLPCLLRIHSSAKLTSSSPHPGRRHRQRVGHMPNRNC